MAHRPALLVRLCWRGRGCAGAIGRSWSAMAKCHGMGRCRRQS